LQLKNISYHDGGLEGRGVGLVQRGTRRHTAFWWVNLKEKEHLEDPSQEGAIIIVIYIKQT
jgi:hypothetical protein